LSKICSNSYVCEFIFIENWDCCAMFSMQRNVIYYRGISHAFSTICRDEGFFGMYKGLGATLLVCVHDAFYSSSFCFFILIRSLSYNSHYYLFCLVQGVGPCIALSFSAYESLRSFWKSQRWIYVFALNWVALYAEGYFHLLRAYGFVNIYGLFYFLIQAGRFKCYGQSCLWKSFGHCIINRWVLIDCCYI